MTYLEAKDLYIPFSLSFYFNVMFINKCVKKQDMNLISHVIYLSNSHHCQILISHRVIFKAYNFQHFLPDLIKN